MDLHEVQMVSWDEGWREVMERELNLTEAEAFAAAAGRLMAEMGIAGMLTTLYRLAGEAAIYRVLRELSRPLGICDCPASYDRVEVHTPDEHRRRSCGVTASYSGPCGGCYDCLAAQWAYYQSLERRGV